MLGGIRVKGEGIKSSVKQGLWKNIKGEKEKISLPTEGTTSTDLGCVGLWVLCCFEVFHLWAAHSLPEGVTSHGLVPHQIDLR